jgi:hypothetical protein
VICLITKFAAEQSSAAFFIFCNDCAVHQFGNFRPI